MGWFRSEVEANNSGCVEKDFCIPYFTKNWLALLSYAEVSSNILTANKKEFNTVLIVWLACFLYGVGVLLLELWFSSEQTINAPVTALVAILYTLFLAGYYLSNALDRSCTVRKRVGALVSILALSALVAFLSYSKVIFLTIIFITQMTNLVKRKACYYIAVLSVGLFIFIETFAKRHCIDSQLAPSSKNNALKTKWAKNAGK